LIEDSEALRDDLAVKGGDHRVGRLVELVPVHENVRALFAHEQDIVGNEVILHVVDGLKLIVVIAG
jgi:hypothetical protein